MKLSNFKTLRESFVTIHEMGTVRAKKDTQPHTGNIDCIFLVLAKLEYRWRYPVMAISDVNALFYVFFLEAGRRGERKGERES